MKKPGVNGMGPKCYAEYLREQGKKPSGRRRRVKKRKRDITKAPTLNLLSGSFNVVDHAKQPTVHTSKKTSVVEINRRPEELMGQEFTDYIPLLEI